MVATSVPGHQAPLGVGIVGCGVIARTHIRALLHFPREARVVSLASRSETSITGAAEYLRAQAEERAAQAAENQDLAGLYRERADQTPSGYLDFHQMLADPAVDAVIVTTPPFLHHPVALAALEAGRHVLCEKPLTVSLREADELIETARAVDRRLAVVSQGRFGDEQRRMRALVQAGALGRIFFCKADTQWYRPASYYELWWRGTWANEGGGALTGQGIHAVDQTLWILGKRPTEVYGQIGTFVHPVPRERAGGSVPIEDTALGMVRFEDGAMAEISAAVTHQLERSQIELYGDQGAVYAYPWTVFSVDEGSNRDLERFVAEDVAPLPAAWQPPGPEIDPYQRPGQTALPVLSMIPQIGDFLDAVRTGRDALTGGGEGRRAIELLAGFYESAIERRPVELPLRLDDPYYEGVAAGLAAASRRPE